MEDVEPSVREFAKQLKAGDDAVKEAQAILWGMIVQGNTVEEIAKQFDGTQMEGLDVAELLAADTDEKRANFFGSLL
jgi:hypothetical protein